MRTRQTWQASSTHPKTTTNSRAHLAQRPPLQAMETKTIMTCKIIAHASNRYAATYRVQARGSVYKVCVEDRPGEDCNVYIDGLDEGSELFRAIQGAVLEDWLGIYAVR
jgi:hypothetical protein